MTRPARPIYETDRDKAIEEATAQAFRLSLVPHCELVECPQFAAADRLIISRGTWLMMLECKRRHRLFDDPRPVELSLAKVLNLRHGSRAFRVPALFVVAFDDRLAYLDLDKTPHSSTREGGRYDRGDPRDIEILAEYRTENFRPVRIANGLAWPPESMLDTSTLAR